MQFSSSVLVLFAAGILAVLAIVLAFRAKGRMARIDTGAVSGEWLTEHRADSSGGAGH